MRAPKPTWTPPAQLARPDRHRHRTSPPQDHPAVLTSRTPRVLAYTTPTGPSPGPGSAGKPIPGPPWLVSVHMPNGWRWHDGFFGKEAVNGQAQDARTPTIALHTALVTMAGL